MAEDRIPLKSREEEQILFGPFDRYAKLIRSHYDVNMLTRDGLLKLVGGKGQVRSVKGILEKILARIRDGEEPETREIERWILGGTKGVAAQEEEEEYSESRSSFQARGHPTRPRVAARTKGQESYMAAIRENAITLAIGPAGSGKTFLAVAMAVEALRKGEFRKLILARPAIEAGEKLGFLPGDFVAKINPYLRPLYDSLNDLLDPGQAKKYMENDVIEIVPLAYMRGRTLNHSFIILDEGQNATAKQMQMFLTRMGEDSKIVVTGDMTQTDLPPSTRSGLADAWARLERIKGIALVQLGKADIVRHALVQKIVEAYEKE